MRECVTEDVHRVGPFGDVYEGREEYVGFLRDLMPTLAGYRMDVERVVASSEGKLVLAELSETVELDGRSVSTQESLVFDFDGVGRIRHVSIYIKVDGT